MLAAVAVGTAASVGAVHDVIILGGGARVDGLYRVASNTVNGAPAYECLEIGSELTLHKSRTKWLVFASGTVLHASSTDGAISAASSPPEGMWAPGGPELLTLRPGACVASGTSIGALSDAVRARLGDAEQLSAARRPASAAVAYRSALELAALRCSGAAGSIASLPLPFAMADAGHTHMKLGQVLRGIPATHPKHVGFAAEAIETLHTAEARMLQWGALRGKRKGNVSPVTLLLTQLNLGHAYLADEAPTRRGVVAAARAFRRATQTSPTSIAARANLGRALVLLARRHLPPASLESNRTLEAAVVAFRRQLALLEAQGVPYRARRDDSFGDERNVPLWWADALYNLGQALQILGAAAQTRYLQTVDSARGGAARPPTLPTLPTPPSSPAGSMAWPWARPGWLAPGNQLLTRMARQQYDRGVSIGLWANAWQRWNVEPPRVLESEAAARYVSRPWLDRRDPADRPHYPHAAVATLEAGWREMRDEIVSWHRSMRTNLTAFDAAAGEDDEVLLHTGKWRLLRFIHPASDGWIRSSVKAAPKTARVLRRIPALRACAARGCTELTAQLSHLVAGSHIAPHCGRGRLSLMLPLVAPPGCCRLQVGAGPPRELVEGRALVFDDSWEHQAWADANRMVLIVDVPRHAAGSNPTKPDGLN